MSDAGASVGPRSKTGPGFRLVLAIAVLVASTLMAPGTVHGAPVAATTLSAGVDQYCATTASGSANCWGWNYYAQLGLGTDRGPDVCGWSNEYPIGCAMHPEFVGRLPDGIRTLSLGYAHSCAVTVAGAAYCWGRNADGQLGVGTTEGPEGCGEYPSACSTVPVMVRGLDSGIAAIGSADGSSCAATEPGAVICWGSNFDGELGDGTTTPSSSPVDVHLPLGTSVIALSGGAWHMCGLTTGGGVLCWGFNEWGQLGDGADSGPEACGTAGEPCSTTPVAVDLPPGKSATAIASGGYFSCALVSGGEVFCWGRGEEGELGRGGTIEDDATPAAVDLPPGVEATSISASTFGACAVTNAGLYCWGSNDEGQLGDGTNEGPEVCGPGEVPCAKSPVPASEVGAEPVAVATAEESTCAIAKTGGVECWGFSRNGGLGDGQTAFSLTPVSVGPLTAGRRLSVSLIGAGSGHISSVPGGVECGASHMSCSGLFADGTAVKLTATAGPGSVFVGFAGGGCAVSGSTCQVAMTAARAVTATFAMPPTAKIVTPEGDENYSVGETVPTRFSCTEGDGGPGLLSCVDSEGAAATDEGSGQLDTATAGSHQYTVTAVSRDGARDVAKLDYTVSPPGEGSGRQPPQAPTEPGPTQRPPPAVPHGRVLASLRESSGTRSTDRSLIVFADGEAKLTVGGCSRGFALPHRLFHKLKSALKGPWQSVDPGAYPAPSAATGVEIDTIRASGRRVRIGPSSDGDHSAVRKLRPLLAILRAAVSLGERSSACPEKSG